MEHITFDSIDEEDFLVMFDTEEKCLCYLASVKWKDGYRCKKCGNDNFCNGKTSFSRRCTRCKHDESARVDTIFEGCRFELPKAFSIAFSVCHSKPESTNELSRKLELRKMTCWAFKKKLLECLQNHSDLASKDKIRLEEILINKL